MAKKIYTFKLDKNPLDGGGFMLHIHVDGVENTTAWKSAPKAKKHAAAAVGKKFVRWVEVTEGEKFTAEGSF